jgi:hypothetical protein
VRRTRENIVLTLFRMILIGVKDLVTVSEILGSIPALPDFLRSSGSGTVFTQPCADN